MRLVVAAATILAALSTATAATAGTPAGPVGTYVFTDGPLLGQVVYQRENGEVLIDGGVSGLILFAADDDCDQPHAHGSYKGDPAPVRPCGWGRVVVRSKLTPLANATASAITEEERAIESLERDPPRAEPILLKYSIEALNDALEELEKARRAGRVSDEEAQRIKRRLTAARTADVKLREDMEDAGRYPGPRKAKKFIQRLRNAIELKRNALDIALHAEQKTSSTAPVPAPGGGRSVAVVQGATITVFWDVFVPKRVKSALCVAKSNGKVTNSAKPLFPGSHQVQRCVVTNTVRSVGGKPKRKIHFEITITGSQTGSPKPTRVTVFWPA